LAILDDAAPLLEGESLQMVAAYVLAAERDAVFDDSAKLFQRLGPVNAANEFVVAEGQEHGFLKRTGKDPVALRELEKAARWAAELFTMTTPLARRDGRPG
jgi:acetyl esterase/lipase